MPDYRPVTANLNRSDQAELIARVESAAAMMNVTLSVFARDALVFYLKHDCGQVIPQQPVMDEGGRGVGARLLDITEQFLGGIIGALEGSSHVLAAAIRDGATTIAQAIRDRPAVTYAAQPSGNNGNQYRRELTPEEIAEGCEDPDDPLVLRMLDAGDGTSY
jgi:hypothetical protein